MDKANGQVFNQWTSGPQKQLDLHRRQVMAERLHSLIILGNAALARGRETGAAGQEIGRRNPDQGRKREKTEADSGSRPLGFKYPARSGYLANRGTMRRATMLTTLIMGLMAGPAVSL